MKMKFKLEELTAEQMDALIKEGYVIETANGDKIPMDEYKKYRRWFNHEDSGQHLRKPRTRRKGRRIMK